MYPDMDMEEEDRLEDGLEGLTVDTNLELSEGAVKKETNDTPPLSSYIKTSPPESDGILSDDSKTRIEHTPSLDSLKPPKLSRKASHKMPPRQHVLFADLPDATMESCDYFQRIPDCLYGSKSLGSTQHDALDCDCSEEWRDGINHACGEDSDCINRATKMECVDRDCNCGDACQNQRFQRKEYANVSVIKTEKKGFGLRADSNLQANDFIFEYIGEVINEPTFRRRMTQYDREGIKHFYFMSLTKNEFVDATKKGNLGRFCNHSCNPNCYVDKWVVGNKLRMGIFAGRKIQAGEELVFNYNVDRYGADPQPCYCGEPNCIGFIGGKTQTERATKLPDATIEALGIDDDDGWDITVAKKPRKKKVEEDDEEYVNSVQARGLDERGVTKVMATLMQCKEKWIAVKLLERIQHCDDDRVRNRIVQMHGYQILKTALNTFIDDHNVVLQILDVLYQFPRLTKNKISDSKIESTIQPLTSSEHEEVASQAARLLDEWSKLAVAYRIPRKKLDSNAQATLNSHSVNSYEERRGNRPNELPAKTVFTLPDNTPKGPRSSVPQRNPTFFNGQRPRRPPTGPLPSGWFATTDKRGNPYYYTKTGETTWQRPTAPATAPEPAASQPKAPSKAAQDQKALQDIIDSLTKPDSAPRRSASQTPQVNTPAQETKKEKWRSLPLDKQMKIYENTLFPHVKHVMNKFRHKLPKEDLKKFAKDINKKLVASDYKNNRVDDPTSITEKQEKKVKNYVKEFLDRAVEKFKAHEQRKAERAEKHGSQSLSGAQSIGRHTPIQGCHHEDEDILISEDEAVGSTPGSSDRKRKREELSGSPTLISSETPSIKRLKEDDSDAPSPPPPPPPLPEGDTTMDMEMAEPDKLLVEQEASLVLEQDEVERQRLREEEAALERENELNMLDFEREQLNSQAVNGNKRFDINRMPQSSDAIVNAKSTAEGTSIEQSATRKHEVLSH